MMQRLPRIESPKHLAFIRTLPCLVGGAGGTEAAHIRFADITMAKRLTGMGEKPGDMWTVPLSNEAHRAQHAMSERSFWAMHQIDPLFIAALLWLHSGNEEAAQIVIMNARSIGQ